MLALLKSTLPPNPPIGDEGQASTVNHGIENKEGDKLDCDLLPFSLTPDHRLCLRSKIGNSNLCPLAAATSLTPYSHLPCSHSASSTQLLVIVIQPILTLHNHNSVVPRVCPPSTCYSGEITELSIQRVHPAPQVLTGTNLPVLNSVSYARLQNSGLRPLHTITSGYSPNFISVSFPPSLRSFPPNLLYSLGGQALPWPRGVSL